MRYCFKIVVCCVLTVAGLAAATLDMFPREATSVVRVDRRTGRLVRAVVAPPAVRSLGVASADAAVPQLVEQTARNHEMDPLLVHSVIQAESSYNPFAVSPKGAQGLMQLMPSTARRFGVSNSFNAAQNVEGGVRYLRHLLDLFHDEKLAVAAYNAGEEAVIRYGGIPPYPETQNYVRTVSGKYASARKAKPAPAPVEVAAAVPQEPVYRPIERFIDAQGTLYLRTR
jgi:soluble lytic murein transglycosylase-like protein